jgi:hypothetical protein
MMRRWTLVVAAVSVLMAACSGGDGTSAADTTTTIGSTTAGEAETTSTVATEPDPETTTSAATAGSGTDCMLLTPEELQTATGVPFADGAYNADLSGEHQSICDWISSGDAFATAQVLVSDWPYQPSKEGSASAFTLVGVTVPGATQAYATEEGSLIGMEIGGRYVQVAYIPAGPGNVLDATTQLAAIVAGRMG